MKQEELILGLKKVVGDDRVITDDASIEVASRDYIGFDVITGQMEKYGYQRPPVL